MIDTRKKAILLLTGIFCFFGFLLLINSVMAATSTVRGKAYWGQYDYLYFNCKDDVIGNRLDQPGNLMGAGRYVDPPSKEEFHFYSVPCSEFQHGVYIGEEGGFYGQAWNPNFGLISFEHNGIDPPGGFGSFNSPCEDACNPSRNCIACYVPETQKVYGWGRIVNETDLNKRWIRLDGYPATSPVSIFTNDSNPIYAGAYLELGDFAGTASNPWADINFNCETEYPGGNSCIDRNYKVYIKNLIFTRLSAPNWNYTNACSSGALRAVLRWDRLSGTQTGYEIVINDSPSFSTSTNDFVCWTGKKSGSAEQYVVYGTDSPDCPYGLEYDTAYYWWLRGYDEDDEPTDWFQYNTNSSSDSDGDRDFNNLTFQTFLHEFPHPFFTWEPQEIITSTSTIFTSKSFVYSTSSPENAISCETNPELCTGFEWSTTDSSAVISATTSPETEIIFYSATNTAVYLSVTDLSNYTCSTSTSFRINYDLPLWREVKVQ